MEENENIVSLDLINDIYKKTMAYSLEKVIVNDDGTTTHLHSDEFLEKHPERASSPEFTEEEEIEQTKFMYDMTMHIEKNL